MPSKTQFPDAVAQIVILAFSVSNSVAKSARLRAIHQHNMVIYYIRGANWYCRDHHTRLLLQHIDDIVDVYGTRDQS